MEIQTALTNIPRTAFSLAEAEVSTGLSRATLYRMIGAGQLKTVQVGGSRRIPAAELERLFRVEQEGAV